MATSTLINIFLLSLLVVPATAMQANSLLASSSKVSLAKRQIAEKRLRNSMSHLATALRSRMRSSCGRCSDSRDLQALAANARDVLMQEAQQLPYPEIAEAMTNYAKWAPDSVLVAPFTNDDGERLASDDAQLGTHMMDEVMQSPDGHADNGPDLVIEIQSPSEEALMDDQSQGSHSSPLISDSSGQSDGSDELTSLQSAQSEESDEETSMHKAMGVMYHEMKDLRKLLGGSLAKDLLGSIISPALKHRAGAHSDESDLAQISEHKQANAGSAVDENKLAEDILTQSIRDTTKKFNQGGGNPAGLQDKFASLFARVDSELDDDTMSADLKDALKDLKKSLGGIMDSSVSKHDCLPCTDPSLVRSRQAKDEFAVGGDLEDALHKSLGGLLASSGGNRKSKKSDVVLGGALDEALKIGFMSDSELDQAKILGRILAEKLLGAEKRVDTEMESAEHLAEKSALLDEERSTVPFTTLENGKLVTRQTICENGHCKTVVKTEELE